MGNWAFMQAISCVLQQKIATQAISNQTDSLKRNLSSARLWTPPCPHTSGGKVIPTATLVGSDTYGTTL